MLAEITREELSAGLDLVAQQILAEAGVYEPPVDSICVAAALGMVIGSDDRQSGRARFVRLRGHHGRPTRPTILLRPEPRDERRQWAVAHEIGEHAAHRVFVILGVDPREAPPDAREAVANQFAGRLLLPGDWFAADAIRAGWDLLQLKSRYTTASHELIARRMLELDPPAIVTIFDHGQIHLRASNVPGRVPSLGPAEIECWRLVHTGQGPQHFFDQTRSIQGWPVHEKDWKREILRTEVDLELAS